MGHYDQTAGAAIPDDDLFVVMVGIGNAKSSPDTVDLDFVVHGVDYSQVLPERKKAFLTKFAHEVRWTVKENINVIVSPRDDKALNVRAQIPAPAALADIRLMEEHLIQKEALIKRDMLYRLQRMAGIEFVSTWTTDAMAVTWPGEKVV